MLSSIYVVQLITILLGFLDSKPEITKRIFARHRILENPRTDKKTSQNCR